VKDSSATVAADACLVANPLVRLEAVEKMKALAGGCQLSAPSGNARRCRPLPQREQSGTPMRGSCGVIRLDAEAATSSASSRQAAVTLGRGRAGPRSLRQPSPVLGVPRHSQ
jgi:hypothetical protein